MAETVPGCEVKVIDATVDKLNYAQIEELMRRESPDVVGIQAMTHTLIDALETAKTAKRVNKNIHVCLGGPHISIYPEETLNFPEVDSVVMGEGEYIFADLLRAIIHGKDLSSVKGIMFKNNGKVISTGSRDLIENLDELPFPARHLTPINKYWSILSRFSPVTTIITSRGCPYKCIFCERPHLGKKFRFRSADNVVNELQAAVESGIKGFSFYDDTFTLNRNRVHDICDDVIKRKLNISWSIRARVDSVDEAMLKKLKSAGCSSIHFGVESGNPDILRVLKKDIGLDQIKSAFYWSRKLGIKTLGYFMLGNPTETRDQILETIAFAKKLNPDYIHVSLTTPFPGTQLYRMGFEKGVLKSDYWKEFACKPDKKFVPKLWEESFSEEELQKLLTHAYKSFYSQPRVILRQLLAVRSIKGLRRKFNMGIRLLFK
ncbi:MAG: hypothetical protein A2X33_02490 [Elusimicrobia bacterium GWA2_51_34]|nr:MAG: hypothetical protein A2X33_02490 [Elusimicrobia bacterium GWA2_51_34]